MGAARDFLKKATSDSHRALDANPLVSGLATGKLKISTYAEMLQAYLGFFEPWEEEMRRQHPELIHRLGESRFEKSRWLREDLSKLGTQEPTFSGPNLPIPADMAELAGWLYVIEGSTLGGMHLSRSSVGLPGGANRFFQSYGSETMERWHEFIEWLEGALPDDDSRQRAAFKATDVFADFQRRFERVVKRCETDSGR